MQKGDMRKLPQATLGRAMPPVNIQGALVGTGPDREYVESRAAVETSTGPLDPGRRKDTSAASPELQPYG
jgi:hypothetical protein